MFNRRVRQRLLREKQICAAYEADEQVEVEPEIEVAVAVMGDRKILKRPPIEETIGYGIEIIDDVEVHRGFVHEVFLKSKEIGVIFEDDNELERIPYMSPDIRWFKST